MTEEQDLQKWADLEKLGVAEIKTYKGEQKRTLSSLSRQRKELIDERREQVGIVKGLRSAFGKMQVAGKERRALLAEFHNVRNLSNKFREQRDEVNRKVPPPSSILREWLQETYTNLTTIDNDLTSVPMLKKELSAFSRFFEIQVAIKVKEEAEKSHKKYTEQIKEMRRITNKLDEGKQEKFDSGNRGEEESDNPGSIDKNEIDKISKRIANIDRTLDSIKEESKKTKFELDRVDSYLSITNRNSGRVKISEIKNWAASGGNLSVSEMGALLETGRLTELGDGKSEEIVKKRQRKSKKKGRRLGVSRGGSRQGSRAGRRE